ncbi:hypothetical protein KEM48_012601 [Puccinia striiformis f. sp. tritici PST-130]|nr:hypothetical protein KEM48_012601 [Puccinia striiformis f. sp. tritici PST-130]
MKPIGSSNTPTSCRAVGVPKYGFGGRATGSTISGKGSCQVFITIKPGRHLAELVKKSIDRESGFPNPPKDEGSKVNRSSQAFGIASGKHRAAIFDELNDRKIGYLNQNKQEDSQWLADSVQSGLIRNSFLMTHPPLSSIINKCLSQ